MTFARQSFAGSSAADGQIEYRSPKRWRASRQANSDFGYDIIPKLIAEGRELFAHKIDNELIAVDTPELYSAVTQKLHTDPPEMC